MTTEKNVFFSLKIRDQKNQTLFVIPRSARNSKLKEIGIDNKTFWCMCKKLVTSWLTNEQKAWTSSQCLWDSWKRRWHVWLPFLLNRCLIVINISYCFLSVYLYYLIAQQEIFTRVLSGLVYKFSFLLWLVDFPFILIYTIIVLFQVFEEK